MPMGGISGGHFFGDYRHPQEVSYECRKAHSYDIMGNEHLLQAADCIMICVDVTNRESLEDLVHTVS